jgi:hypothetical protein
VSKELAGKIKTELLFIERCLDLLLPGGRLGIVLPEGVFNHPSLNWRAAISGRILNKWFGDSRRYYPRGDFCEHVHEARTRLPSTRRAHAWLAGTDGPNGRE